MSTAENSSFWDSNTSDSTPAQQLASIGFAILSPRVLSAEIGAPIEACAPLFALWEDLPADPYLLDGGHYRRRRHGSFMLEHADDPISAHLRSVPQRPHWQPKTYNALHGGLFRHFAPLSTELSAAPAFVQLLQGLGRLFASARSTHTWFIEAHQFRIDTHEGIGRPTPEGAHRDGVDFIAVLMIARHQIIGGETRVFEAEGMRGVRFTLEEPCSALLMDDTRVIHESTPIQPADKPDAGWRDTLVLTFRSDGFLEPGS